MVDRKYSLIKILLLASALLCLPGLSLLLPAQTVGLELRRVSVASKSQPFVHLNWALTGSPNDYIIKIMKYTGGGYMPYDSISQEYIEGMQALGLEPTWTDIDSEHDIKPERYAITLEDTGGNSMTPLTFGHETIFLHPLEAGNVDRCNGSISMTWDNYKYFSTTGLEEEQTPFFTHNRIIVYPPGNVQPEGVVVDELDFPLQGYEYTFGYGPGEYVIGIQAVEKDNGGNVVRFSNSNFRTFVFERPMLTGIEIQKVDIILNRDVEVVFSVQENEPGDMDEYEYNVSRSDSESGPFITLGPAQKDITGAFFSFLDANPGLDSGPWFYIVDAFLTGCPDASLLSEAVSTLFLEGEIATYTETELLIALAGFHFPGATDYRLYRQLHDEVDFSFIKDVPDLNLAGFEDDLSARIADLSGTISYRLEATYGNETIHSNIISVVVNVGLELYNAFNPYSENPDNRYFRPRLRGQVASFYRLRVFDHWGQQVFIMTDPLEDWLGWDGKTSDGKVMPPGVYGYRFEYQVGSGPRLEKTGTINLIR